MKKEPIWKQEIRKFDAQQYSKDRNEYQKKEKLLEKFSHLANGFRKVDANIDIEFMLKRYLRNSKNKTIAGRKVAMAKMFFGVGGCERHTMPEIAIYFGISRQRVYQILTEDMRWLRLHWIMGW